MQEEGPAYDGRLEFQTSGQPILLQSLLNSQEEPSLPRRLGRRGGPILSYAMKLAVGAITGRFLGAERMVAVAYPSVPTRQLLNGNCRIAGHTSGTGG